MNTQCKDKNHNMKSLAWNDPSSSFWEDRATAKVSYFPKMQKRRNI